jgi:uncharacterized repeat protein (TIGR01451 family)
VRLTGLAGAKATFYPGTPGARRYDTPVTAGLRPGYSYRLQLTDLPEYPGLELYPSLEVRGTLRDGPSFNPAHHPAPITLDSYDLERIAAGGLVTKVIYLEHPAHAIPTAAQPDQQLLWETRAGQDPCDVAREYGRPVLIVRVGQRTPTQQELLHESVPQTIALPDAPILGIPPVGPCLPFASYDPTYGPRHPEEECLKDGGDAPPLAGFGPGGRLAGVGPADTVAEYKDKKGTRRIAVSNEICICVPRFGVVRAVVLPSGYDIVTSLQRSEIVLVRETIRTRVPPQVALQQEQLVAMVGRERPTEALVQQGVIDISQLWGTVQVVGRIEGREIIGTLCEKVEKPACPLLLRKWADKHTAQLGDVVTIFLQYSNPGGQPISDVAVVDSLTTRLEYVMGSQKSDRAALFSLQENEAGSVKLRWEVRGQLLPGHSGLISFQVRVR